MRNLKLILRSNYKLFLLLLFIVIYVLVTTKLIKYESIYTGKETNLEGRIKSISINGNKVTMLIDSKEKVMVYYYLKNESEKSSILDNIHLGDKIALNGKLNKPLNNTIPNTFNYKNYLYNKKIYYTFTANNYSIISSNNIFYQIKDYLLKRAYNLDNSAYFLVFILGDKTLLSSEEYNNFQTNGISHLLAISGMHISIIIGLLSTFLKKLGEKKEFLITSLVLLFFAFITSFTSSVMRAVIFYYLSKINKIYNLKYSNIKLLIITAIIILLINPFYIYDLGFIYSFVVCFGIMYYSDKLTGNYLLKLLKVSLISFLFSLPINIYYNYEFNLTQIITNIIFVPLISLVIYPFSLLTYLFPFLNNIFTFLLKITTILNKLFTYTNVFINVPKTSIIFVILLFLILIKIKNNNKYLSLYIFIILLIKGIPLLNNNYQVYYLDVGQGDSAILISPHEREVIMIDTGGSIEYEYEDWEVSSKTYHISDNTIKFLKSKGITKIDYLILSHGDADHCGEAINIIDNMKVKNIVLNNGTYNYLEQNIINKDINITNNYNLDYFNITNLNNIDYQDENENSIINYITFLNYKLLFMGDASSKQEDVLVNKYNISNIDIIKLGHHGSKTSTGDNFLNNIKIQLSIISSGRNNRYNHPSKEVIDSLNKYHINYLNTQDNGTIEVIFSKYNYTINTYKP